MERKPVGRKLSEKLEILVGIVKKTDDLNLGFFICFHIL
ncbi:hypothetical protein STZ1_10533 [Bacillus subtilis]